ncbi:hypothetical protein [Mycoplasma leonicaptivi]|uniref:hypothetical protein n=1 Tax=Mycoplasma leonicaptivi TaxID=36742 RepID=UPI00048646C2|nr:hypothetical protein [Mycoplasma leonicaptivi]
MKKPIKEIIKQKILNKEYLFNKYKHIANLYDIEPNKDIILLTSILTAQRKSIIQQNLVQRTFTMNKIASNIERGDLVGNNGEYIEVKISTPSAYGNKLNVVQIRAHQNIDFYYCIFIDDINYKNNFFFVLTKEQIQKEIILIGTLAHGVKNSKNVLYKKRI